MASKIRPVTALQSKNLNRVSAEAGIMMNRTEIDRLMRELYAARQSGDLEAVFRSFSTDAEFQIANASQTSQIVIKASGAEEFRPLLAVLIKTFRLSDLTIRSVTIDGCQATVHWWANVRSRITGANAPTELIDIVEVRQTAAS